MDINQPDDQPLAIENEAWAWIAKLSGDRRASEAEVQALHAWMAQSPLHHQTFKRLSQSWDDMDLLQALASPQAQVLAPRPLLSSLLVYLLSPLLLLWLALSTGLQKALSYSELAPGRFAAASFAVVLSVSVGLWYSLPPSSAVYVTAVGQQSSHQLPDGSRLVLNTNSKVSVAFLADKRLLTLHRGEAHFDVEPDKNRPFEVYAGTRMVRAVGTAFSVYMESERVEVTVSEGKVALGVQSSPPQTEPLKAVDGEPLAEPTAVAAPEILGALVAGQSVVIPPGPAGVMDDITQHEKQSLKRRLSWLEGQLVYAGEGLAEVLADVSRYTPVYIEVMDPALDALRIGGQFKVGETEALFRVLEVGFGLKVTYVSEHHVQIHQP